MNEMTERILNNTLYLILSTVCDDGAPWGTPVHFAYDEHYVYWLSHTETQHSRNIARDSRVFIVVFDSRQNSGSSEERGAVYISTRAELLDGEDALNAREVYSDRYPDDNGRRASEWGVYRAAIGMLDDVKTKDQMIYYREV
jgi:uncharacterized protein YhbP (UPF0306 family)